MATPAAHFLTCLTPDQHKLGVESDSFFSRPTPGVEYCVFLDIMTGSSKRPSGCVVGFVFGFVLVFPAALFYALLVAGISGFDLTFVVGIEQYRRLSADHARQVAHTTLGRMK